MGKKYSPTAGKTVAYILALYEEGVDGESISRRLKTEKCTLPQNEGELQWISFDTHDVNCFINRYRCHRRTEREKG